MTTRKALELEYTRFLSAHGLSAMKPSSNRSAFETIRSELASATDASGLEKYDLSSQPFNELLHTIEQAGEQTLHDVVNVLSKEIESALEDLESDVATPIFAGVFPTGSFNAVATPCDGGALALLNSGLMMCIHQIVKIVLHKARFAEFDEQGKPKVDTAIDSSPLSHEELVLTLAQVLLAYAGYTRTSRIRRLPMGSVAKSMLAASLVKSTEKFVLAHEYGHAVAGHLANPKTVVTRTRAGEVGLIAKSWEQEMEADVIALGVLLASAPRIVDSQEKMFELEMVVSGPLIFFGIANLLERVVEEVEGFGSRLVAETHPPPQMRLDLVKRFLRDAGCKDVVFRLTDASLEMLSQMASEVIVEIRKLSA